MEKTAKYYEERIKFLESRIDDLEKSLEYEREQGRAVPDYQIDTIIRIRELFPAESSQYSDDKISMAYSLYCEENHAASWTETDLSIFGKWCFRGAISIL